jgi:hypothetical protein
MAVGTDFPTLVGIAVSGDCDAAIGVVTHQNAPVALERYVEGCLAALITIGACRSTAVIDLVTARGAVGWLTTGIRCVQTAIMAVDLGQQALAIDANVEGRQHPVIPIAREGHGTALERRPTLASPIAVITRVDM